MAGLLLLNLVLENLGLDLQVGEFLTQPLSLDSQIFSLLLANLDLLLHHDGSFDRDIVLGLEVLQRGRGIPRLALKVVVGHLDIA